MTTPGILSSTRSDQKSKILRERHEAIWAEMRAENYDAIVVAGRGLITQYGYLEYVIGWCPQVRLAYAVVLPGQEPILIMPTNSDAWFARQATGLTDVRAAGQGDVISEQDSLPQVIADVITEHRAGSGKIGVVGLRHIVPVGDYEMLKNALSQAQITDATALVGRVKAIKSMDERAEVVRSAAIADAGMEVFAQRAGLGVAGWELWGDIQQEVRRRGAQHVLVMVGTGPFFNDPPRSDALKAGDLASVYVEITGPNGFWVEKASLFAVGSLSDEKQRLAQACLASHAAAEAALRAGNTAADVAVAIEKVATPAGVDFGIWHGHGVGVDHDIPVITQTDETVLAEGMVMALHPNFVNTTTTVGVSVADTYIVQEGAPQRGSKTPQELRHIERND